MSIGSNWDERVAVEFYRAKAVGHRYSKKLTSWGKNSKEIYGVLKIGCQSRHAKEIHVERNHEERLVRKLLPTFYLGHAVGKQMLGTYGEVLTTANDLTTQEIYTFHCWRRIAAMLAGSSLAAIKTLTGLKSDTVVYHYTNNSGIAISSIRRLSAASQPPCVRLVL